MKLLIGCIISLLIYGVSHIAYIKNPSFVLPHMSGALTVLSCMLWYDYYDRNLKG
jgi:hypothetical protein